MLSALDPLSATLSEEAYAAALQGTIVANRTDAAVRFFLEGQTYDIAPRRALGLALPRSTAILTLFNCDASLVGEARCFWDPYLLQRDGFYEVLTGEESGSDVDLTLSEAGAPPGDQVWVQNRTGAREAVVIDNQLIELPPASVQEFAVASDVPTVIYLRNCIVQGGQSVCEWAPHTVESGFYYGLVKDEFAGPSNSQLTNVTLESVVAASGTAVERPPQATCRLRVPTLNVRGGPGLEFPIVAKIRGTAEQPGSVIVTSSDVSREWLQVSARVAADGWITSNPDFIVCSGDLAALPSDW